MLRLRRPADSQVNAKQFGALYRPRNAIGVFGLASRSRVAWSHPVPHA
jgi:hypothetical protein